MVMSSALRTLMAWERLTMAHAVRHLGCFVPRKRRSPARYLEPLTADLEEGREFRVARAATVCGRATARVAPT